jgi:branched-chain amino acid transport system substrate-binding protein
VAAVDRRLALVLAVFASALLLAACGGGDNNKVTGVQTMNLDNCDDAQYSGSGTPSKLIVSDLPLQGDSAERSKQQNDAIVQEIARKGWRAGNDEVAFQACDDSIASTGEWDEATCKANARAYANNPDVITVIGTYNSGCAALEIPILNQAPGGGLAMVSPGNTLVCLTEPGSGCEDGQPKSLYPSGKRNYLRVVPNDAVQGAGLATFADEQQVKAPYILYAADDPTSTGQARNFRGAAQQLGMQIKGFETWDEKAASYTDLMKKVQKSDADAVLLAGLLEENGAQIIKDKVAVLGPNDGKVKLLAPDGFAQQNTINQAGSASKDMLVSLPGEVPTSLTGEGEAFVKELQAQIGADTPMEVFAPYAGEAAEVVMNAIRISDGTRAGVIDTLFKTPVKNGITGDFTFTDTGDPTPSSISVQRAGDTFVLEKTISPATPLVAAARNG